jgi:hypothetical protein
LRTFVSNTPSIWNKILQGTASYGVWHNTNLGLVYKKVCLKEKKMGKVESPRYKSQLFRSSAESQTRQDKVRNIPKGAPIRKKTEHRVGHVCP